MYNKLKDRLDGCFYTIFTPFDSNYKIDFEGVKKYIFLCGDSETVIF